jgi:hypothetical protein
MSYGNDGRTRVDQAREARELATLRGWLSVTSRFPENWSSGSKVEMGEHKNRKPDRHTHSMISHKSPFSKWKESKLTISRTTVFFFW